MTANTSLIAYEIEPAGGMLLNPAGRAREWMSESESQFAYRCLPMLIANQAGWFISCPVGFTVRWRGGRLQADLEIQFHDQPDQRIKSHFGHGIVTFTIPYLFRTPPEVNLWVKGPSNSPKEGIHALEGVVETDWSPATFTMNWKLTRQDHDITFKAGEPICMIVPVMRGLAEQMAPKLMPIESAPVTEAAFRGWEANRTGFLRRLKEGEPDAVAQGWQRDYFKGQLSTGAHFERHQVQLQLRDFVRE